MKSKADYTAWYVRNRVALADKRRLHRSLRQAIPQPEEIELKALSKQCPKCNETKDGTAFYWRAKHRCLDFQCKTCALAVRAEHYRRNRHVTLLYQKRVRIENRAHLHAQKSRSYRLRVYNLSAQSFEALLMKQDGKCAICQHAFQGQDFLPEIGQRQRIHVDHDHATGRVRGLLCRFCNWMLGNAKDDQSRLSAAIRYLQQPPASFLQAQTEQP